jgi:hypothetical protein
MCGKKGRALPWASHFWILASATIGIQTAWKLHRRGQPLCILDVLLQGLATNRVTILIHILVTFRKINHCGIQLHALILFKPKKRPSLHPEQEV